VVCWQLTLCDPHLSALKVRFSRRCAIQIDVYLYLYLTNRNGRSKQPIIKAANQMLALFAVSIYATHATQSVALRALRFALSWKPGLMPALALAINQTLSSISLSKWGTGHWSELRRDHSLVRNVYKAVHGPGTVVAWLVICRFNDT